MNDSNENYESPKVLSDRTQPIIKSLEGLLDGKLICYWMSPSGSLCQNDVSAFAALLEAYKDVENLYIFIKSDGGTGRAALRMVNLLRSKCQKMVALVPLNCESAATMLALGADEVQMGPMAFLTPVDTSIRHDLSPVDNDNDLVSIGTNELERIISLWDKHSPGDRSENVFSEVFKHIHPLAVAAVDRAGSLSNMLCNEIMSYHMKDESLRKSISQKLNSDYPSHGYPIVLREAQRIGIPATTLPEEINAKLIELNEIYSEMGKRYRHDFSPLHHRDNEILNIIEGHGKMIYYIVDKEWHYRENERTWRSTNDGSSYRERNIAADGSYSDDIFHIR